MRGPGRVVAILLIGLSADMAARMVSAQTSSANPPAAPKCQSGEIPWTQEPVNARACTCADLNDLLSALQSARRFRDLYQSIAGTLSPLEGGGMSVADSNAYFKRAENSGGATIQNAQGTSGEIAWTWNPGCYTCIPKQNLTSYCRDILEEAWNHEASHRQTCQSQAQQGKESRTVSGSANAIDERDAYAATIPPLRDAILRLLGDARLTWKGTTDTVFPYGRQIGASTGEVKFKLTPETNYGVYGEDLFFKVSGAGKRVDSVKLIGGRSICHHHGGPTEQPERLTARTDLDQLTLIFLSPGQHEIPVASDNCSQIKKWPIDGPGDVDGGFDDLSFRDGVQRRYSDNGSQNDRNGTYTLELCPQTPASGP